MAKAIKEAVQAPAIVMNKIKVTFVMEVPDYLTNQQSDSDFIREGINHMAEGLIASVESIDIATVN
jgi:hypothetical protein